MLLDLSPLPPPLPRSRLPLGNYGWLYRGLKPCPSLTADEIGHLAASMTSKKPTLHPDLPAGYTYLGQFIAHDLSFNPSSARQLEDDPELLYNHRTPALDLDSLYGRGPDLQPYLYSIDDGASLLTGGAAGYGGSMDLARNQEGRALLADPRNDENLILSQLALSFLLFHNEVLAGVVLEEGRRHRDAFERARTLVRWHYQWLVLHDYLPRILHPDVLERLEPIIASCRRDGVRQLRHYDPTTAAYLPIEFAAAAFRFGHALVRETYDLNPVLAGREGQEIPLFDPSRHDLRGNRKLPDGWHVEWRDFLPIDGSHPQTSSTFDTHLARPLGRVPLPGDRTLNLAAADLEMGQVLGLPSGQELARAMGISHVLGPEEIEIPATAGLESPLWYYVLKEAQVQQGGRRLGLLGSEIVGEVLLGVVLLDRFSYLAVNPAWQPMFADRGVFGLADLVKVAWGGGALAEPSIAARAS